MGEIDSSTEYAFKYLNLLKKESVSDIDLSIVEVSGVFVAEIYWMNSLIESSQINIDNLDGFIKFIIKIRNKMGKFIH